MTIRHWIRSSPGSWTNDSAQLHVSSGRSEFQDALQAHPIFYLLQSTCKGHSINMELSSVVAWGGNPRESDCCYPSVTLDPIFRRREADVRQ